MPFLKVAITEIVDEDFPLFVKCQFRDAYDQQHSIIEKLSVVCGNSEALTSRDLPREGYVACIVEGSLTSEKGDKLLRINTEHPWSISSQEGTTNFLVDSSLILAEAPP